mmetsp:Transcript_15198/g.43183  ORF Transcript_15198/g.43183 Transcript_15198/m.43183 type:complete len:244 (+) Transcript_15198:143-874(+)|eukprot:CAMPEP_0119154694 /NCGR_PEP_ID=MMETSP1310-20130426/51151_1 /TAXON_ID=464262 /ORGANISM="Genus nov. species nov., Strain RCC2339" /LENGTH=243 /DNA_ID=CAMNT_0007147235 /DNA_START=66 /DNA_END=797 /DNA_ORIENTATION=-
MNLAILSVLVAVGAVVVLGVEVRIVEPVLYVHVGKSAGGTIRAFLQSLHVKYKKFHLHDGAVPLSELELFRTLIVAMRDPTERVISGYNWNKNHIPRHFNRHSFDPLFQCSPSARDFCNCFLSQNRSGCCRTVREGLRRGAPFGHISVGLETYFADILDSLKAGKWPGQILAVNAEHLQEDLTRLANIVGENSPTALPCIRCDYQTKTINQPTEAGRAALRRHLELETNEYDIYNFIENHSVL